MYPSDGLIRLALVIFLVSASTTRPANGQAPETKHAFSDYPAKEYTGKPHRLDLSSDPAAKEFQTRLRAVLRAGPNFAGHFAVVTWGCGSACTKYRIVDVATGRVFPADTTLDFSCHTLTFEKTSRLVIQTPLDLREWDESCGQKGVRYFIWEHQRFRKLTP
jgi:hypothetical protein